MRPAHSPPPDDGANDVERSTARLDLRSAPTVAGVLPVPMGGPAIAPVANDSQEGSRAQTSMDALLADEVLRTRRYLGTMSVMFLVVAILLPIFGGDPFFKTLFTAALATTFLSYIVFLAFIRDARRYTPGRVLVPVMIGCLGGLAAGFYYGLFSPACMVFTLGIYFFSLSSSVRVSITVYATSATLQGVAMLLLAFDHLPDRGLVSVAGLPTLERLGILSLVQVVYVMTFLFGRQSRHATFTALKNFEVALRQVGQREALLQEAHQDLERALGGDDHGRWSGERVGGWQLSRVLGRGGMCDVYEAYSPERQLRAAMKLLHPQSERSPEQLSRFLREAQVMSQLDSQHVVKVYDVSGGVDGPPYIAMELLEGQDLARYLRRHRRLDPDQTLQMVAQVAEVLELARREQIVHRDLKPQNLFRVESAPHEIIWKVLDFGISKVGNSGTMARGEVLGTVGYMAPEQARGAEVDHRADIFSLALLAYRALTGQPAFLGEGYGELMSALAFSQPKRPGELAPLPPQVDAVFAVALAKNPAERFDSAREFSEALHRGMSEQLSADLARRAQAILAVAPWGGRTAYAA